jgi:glycosyltransferase involved in cell wall biosynthesis
VLTPVLPSASEHLKACEQSVNELTYALGYYGIIVQWLVAVDGPGDIGHQSYADHVVHLPERVGPAKARNSLLPYAKGEWIVPMDCDDLFDIKGMEDLAQHLIDCDDDLGWLAANRLLTSGERTPHWNNLARRVKPGSLSENWESPFAFHPNSMVIRRSLLNNLGGWPVIEVNEDMALALMLSEHAKGFIATDVMTRYRIWHKQAVSQAEYPEQKKKAFAEIEVLLNHQSEMLGRAPVSSPSPGMAYGVIPQAAKIA